MLYCTFDFSPEANEAVVNHVLNRLGDGAQLEPESLNLDNLIQCLSEWEGRWFDPQLAGAVRILPTAEREGFFLWLLRKLE